jgi:hypothetical protein
VEKILISRLVKIFFDHGSGSGAALPLENFLGYGLYDEKFRCTDTCTAMLTGFM